jgi:hypothetical protein
MKIFRSRLAVLALGALVTLPMVAQAQLVSVGVRQELLTLAVAVVAVIGAGAKVMPLVLVARV